MTYTTKKLIEDLENVPMTTAACEAVTIASMMQSNYERVLVYLGRCGYKKNEIEDGVQVYLGRVYNQAMKGLDVRCPNDLEGMTVAIRRGIPRTANVCALAA